MASKMALREQNQKRPYNLKVLELGQYGKNYYIADVKNKKGVVFTVRLSHLKKYSKT